MKVFLYKVHLARHVSVWAQLFKTGLLVVKMLTVLVFKVQYLIYSYFCCKNVSSFCKCKSYSHFFSKNISLYAIFNDQNFNNTLTNDIISFEQLGPGLDILLYITSACPNVMTVLFDTQNQCRLIIRVFDFHQQNNTFLRF